MIFVRVLLHISNCCQCLMHCICHCKHPTDIHNHAAFLSKPFPESAVHSLPPSQSVAPSPSFPLSLPLSLCESVVWALSQVECVFLNEYLMRLMRLAGGGAVSGVLREKERGGRQREGESEVVRQRRSWRSGGLA